MPVPTPINLNDSTPAPPSGFQNSRWQGDTNDPRNCSSNSPWTGSVLLKSANYAGSAADCGHMLVFTAAATYTLPAAPPFGQWCVFVQNNSTGAVVLSAGSLTVNGVASLSLAAREGAYIATDGTNYYAQLASSLVLETNGTPNGSQSLLDLVAGQNIAITDDGAGNITIAFSGVLPVANGGTGSSTPSIFWGQVPRGTKDGTNTAFTTDFQLASPFTLLTLNGIAQMPTVDSNLGNTANPDYSVTTAGAIAMNYAPQPTDELYFWYFRNAGSNQPTAATLYLTSAHVISPSGGTNFGGGASFTQVSTIAPVPDWFHSTAAWSTRTDSVALTGTHFQNLLNGQLYLLLMIENDGGATPTLSPPEQLLVYDCYVVITMANGSTQTWRPHSSAAIVTNATGSVTNAANALDADPATYATISCSGTGGAGLGGVFLNLSNFG